MTPVKIEAFDVDDDAVVVDSSTPVMKEIGALVVVAVVVVFKLRVWKGAAKEDPANAAERRANEKYMLNDC